MGGKGEGGSVNTATVEEGEGEAEGEGSTAIVEDNSTTTPSEESNVLETKYFTKFISFVKRTLTSTVSQCHDCIL